MGVPDRAVIREPDYQHEGTRSGRGVRVAVVAGAWRRNLIHPRVQPGIGLVDPGDDLRLHNSPDAHDRIGHGTRCAQIVLDIAPEAHVVPIRIFGHRLEPSVEQVVAGLRSALDQNVAVVSMSLATLRPDAIRPLYAACEDLCAQAVILVAAAFPPGERGYPAV